MTTLNGDQMTPGQEAHPNRCPGFAQTRFGPWGQGHHPPSPPSSAAIPRSTIAHHDRRRGQRPVRPPVGVTDAANRIANPTQTARRAKHHRHGHPHRANGQPAKTPNQERERRARKEPPRTPTYRQCKHHQPAPPGVRSANGHRVRKRMDILCGAIPVRRPSGIDRMPRPGVFQTRPRRSARNGAPTAPGHHQTNPRRSTGVPTRQTTIHSPTVIPDPGSSQRPPRSSASSALIFSRKWPKKNSHVPKIQSTEPKHRSNSPPPGGPPDPRLQAVVATRLQFGHPPTPRTSTPRQTLKTKTPNQESERRERKDPRRTTRYRQCKHH